MALRDLAKLPSFILEAGFSLIRRCAVWPHPEVVVISFQIRNSYKPVPLNSIGRPFHFPSIYATIVVIPTQNFIS